jgi:hypothetical protein
MVAVSSINATPVPAAATSINANPEPADPVAASPHDFNWYYAIHQWNLTMEMNGLFPYRELGVRNEVGDILRMGCNIDGRMS